MRIGWISSSLPYLPSAGGFRIAGANLIRRISRRHSVDLISLTRDDDEQHSDWIARYCDSVVTIPCAQSKFIRRVADFVSGYVCGGELSCRSALQYALGHCFEERNWDVLHVEGGLVGGFIPARFPIAKVLSVHDAEVLRCQEILRCAIGPRGRVHYHARVYYQRRYARLVYPRFECCVHVAERDVAFNKKLVPGAKFKMIPYGVDGDYFKPMAIKKERFALVFHGHLNYPPNIQASIEFANDIFPLIQRECPDSSFHLVGASPAREIRRLTTRPGSKVSADLSDLRATVCSAEVYVSAVRYGSGIKNKILEAMAMRLPIVGYAGSTAGIECVSGKHILVADGPQQFAACVLDLLNRPDRANQIAKAGRELVEERYSWESAASAYETLYAEVIAERAARSKQRRAH